jgi:hypothetical protein
VRRGWQDGRVSEISRVTAEDALGAVYQKVATVADGLGEADLMLPSRCAGWALSDLLYHQLLDARRALRAFASPAAGPPDVDDVSYWAEWSPAVGETGRAPERRGGRARPACADRRVRLRSGQSRLGMA